MPCWYEVFTVRRMMLDLAFQHGNYLAICVTSYPSPTHFFLLPRLIGRKKDENENNRTITWFWMAICILSSPTLLQMIWHFNYRPLNQDNAWAFEWNMQSDNNLLLIWLIKLLWYLYLYPSEKCAKLIMCLFRLSELLRYTEVI